MCPLQQAKAAGHFDAFQICTQAAHEDLVIVQRGQGAQNAIDRRQAGAAI